MATGSILYVTESPQLDQQVLAMAQRAAIAEDLPIAVVYCLETTDKSDQVSIIESFAAIEAQLEEYAIPLMILIGSREKVLPWMSGHVKPVRIFTDGDRVEGRGGLVSHPIAWAGTVMTTTDLLEMIQTSNNYCLPD